jgi:sulfate adenylyltransferase subunit 2
VAARVAGGRRSGRTRMSDAITLNPPHPHRPLSPHLARLEAEAIFIMREVVAEFSNPVMLYSVGKDSSVMLHIARKAFYPGKLPFPFLHIASGWDFRELLEHRDRMTRLYGLDLIVHSNVAAQEAGINPFDTPTGDYTRLLLTDALKQGLDAGKYDAAFGGGRRDEEKSRAKERIFSHRSAEHVWNPREQRPELWRLFNTRIAPGESMRVFPLSNWTELDIWDYIAAEAIPIVPLYLAAERPVVRRGDALLVVDDERMRWQDGETARMERVRFRTLGCWPLTAASHSDAATVDDIVSEIIASRASERQGRLVDAAAQASMERKKREGYF